MRGVTKTNIETLKMIAKGLSNDEIAKGLFLSKKGIEGQVYKLLLANGIKNRVQLTIMALKAGVIDLKDL